MEHVDPRDQRIVELEAALAERNRRIDELLDQVTALQNEIRDFKSKLNQDSSNSSRPPSSDMPGKNKRKYGPKRGPSGKKRGGQPGHKGARREFLPPDQVAKTTELYPECCSGCGHAFEGNEEPVGEPLRHQVTELPPVLPLTDEWRQHQLCCPCCGKLNRAKLPVGVPRTAYGPRLQAVVTYLSGICDLSRREVEQALANLFGVKLSVGTIQDCCERTSAGLATPYEEAKLAVRTSAVVHGDETGWKQAGKRHWLWLVTSDAATLFHIAESRGGKVICDLLGERFSGVLVTDRWSAYTKLPKAVRQICWAHLKRDFQSLVDLGGESKKTGQWALKELKLLFELWHDRLSGKLDASGLAGSLPPLKARFKRLLNHGANHLESKRGKGMCASLLKHWDAFWTFLKRDGVEPTNNTAEQRLRKAVLWRKKSQGTRSDGGARFVERILSVDATCRQNGRNPFDYLVEACTAGLTGQPPPLLLPATL